MNEETKNNALEYIKALAAIEEEMEPYKEHKRELRSNYIKQGFLTRDEMRTATRAFRMIKKGDSLEDLIDVFNTLTNK